MWKIAHPTPKTTATSEPHAPVGASSQRSRKMISPAYMLPNKRSACDSGLDTYSIALSSRLGIHNRGVLPKRAQNSSWIQPPRPLAAIENQIMSSHTERASAKVVLTSAVGTRRQAG